MACWAGLVFCFAAALSCTVFHRNRLYVLESPPFFPEGTQVTQTDDRGFRAGRAATDTAHIPPKASEEFAQKLREDGFKETPLSDSVQQNLMGIKELEYVVQVTNGLWYFRDDSPREFPNQDCTDFLLEIYDLNVCIYYSIEYDF